MKKLICLFFVGITLLFCEERIKPVPAEKLKAILKKAPSPPKEEINLGLKLRLIDYIDCTNPNDPHDFMDQGTSKVITGPAGKYRITAPHNHAFFAYGYKTQGKDKPVLIVIEYPDDARRRFAFLTHDSMRPARPHVSFSIEAGVYTGEPLPNTNKMRYFTIINWPQDNWSPLLVVNYDRYGGGGVASRIWVYAIEKINPLKINYPDDKNKRILDAFFCLGFLPKRDLFGWKSPQSISHMVDYCKIVGINRVTMMLYANQSWGGMVEVPSWDVPDDGGFLDDVLTQMDKKGGVGLIVGIVADGMYGDLKHKGQIVRNLPKEKAKEIIIKGFDEIIDKYGKYKSFKGFAFGSMEATGFLQTLKELGILQDVINHIKKRRPDFDIITYLGNAYLQTPYFQPFEDKRRNRSYPAPTTDEVIFNWEKTDGDWEKYLGDLIWNDWIKWGFNPKYLLSIPGLKVYEKTLPDDHRIVDSYRNDPRCGIYYDTLNCEYLSKILNTPYGAIFSTFDEGWLGLSKGYNFWYGKYWTAPDFNPANPFSIAPWSILMAHNDRLEISAGSWNCKYFGFENLMRKFAKSYLSLPPVRMDNLSVEGLDFIKVRWKIYKNKRYICLINRIPFSCNVTVDGKRYNLEPFELFTIIDEKKTIPQIKGNVPEEFVLWTKERIKKYKEIYQKVKTLQPQAAPQVYMDVINKAEKYLKEGKVFLSSKSIPYGLYSELKLRYQILSPFKIKCPKIEKVPIVDGDLSDWPENASEYIADSGKYLEGHTYFPNSWHGPKDLSARLKFCNDGKNLYIGIEVTDDKFARKENVSIWLSKDGYKNWKDETVSSDIKMSFAVRENQGNSNGIRYKTAIKDNKFIIECLVPIERVCESKNSIGFLFTYNDIDDAPSIDKRKSWAKKQVLHFPHNPKWALWKDARNCGEITIEK